MVKKTSKQNILKLLGKLESNKSKCVKKKQNKTNEIIKKKETIKNETIENETIKKYNCYNLKTQEKNEIVEQLSYDICYDFDEIDFDLDMPEKTQEELDDIMKVWNTI